MQDGGKHGFCAFIARTEAPGERRSRSTPSGNTLSRQVGQRHLVETIWMTAPADGGGDWTPSLRAKPGSWEVISVGTSCSSRKPNSFAPKRCCVAIPAATITPTTRRGSLNFWSSCFLGLPYVVVTRALRIGACRGSALVRSRLVEGTRGAWRCGFTVSSQVGFSRMLPVCMSSPAARSVPLYIRITTSAARRNRQAIFDAVNAETFV